MCNAVNEQTSQSIKAKIVENFEDENLCEPEFKVYPQMRKVKNFFKGGFEKPRDERERKKGKKERSQMRKEIGFYYQGEQDKDEIITKDELVKEITKKTTDNSGKKPVTAVVASAGSGKTTLLRRVADEVLNSCPVFSLSKETKVIKSHLKMVYYMDMKHMKFDGKLKPSQFLFDGSYKTEREIDDAYEWLLKKQHDAILFFDGLDQATFEIDESSERRLKPFQEGTASEIMYNILSRNLLPDTKVVIASREFKVSELPAEARPREIISLVGFKRDDAQKLFVALIKDQGYKIWDDIKRLSPRLLNILSVPVFLVLAAAIMAGNSTDPPPTTITELYNRIMTSLGRLETIKERRQIFDIVQKMKEMAHQGMLDGRIVFRKDDLETFGLTVKDARDLMIMIPGNKFLTRYLFEGDFEFYFCHQSLQEFLSASFIAEMDFDMFSAFNESHLHKSRWSIVRTFVSGIIHDSEASEIHTGLLFFVPGTECRWGEI